MMEVRVWAPFHLAVGLPAMRQKKSGAIINISSSAGIHPGSPTTAGAAARSTACARLPWSA
jgi:short-subunit dehydrogenase